MLKLKSYLKEHLFCAVTTGLTLHTALTFTPHVVAVALELDPEEDVLVEVTVTDVADCAFALSSSHACASAGTRPSTRAPKTKARVVGGMREV